MLNTSKFSPEVQKTIKNMETRLKIIRGKIEHINEQEYLEEVLGRFK